MNKNYHLSLSYRIEMSTKVAKNVAAPKLDEPVEPKSKPKAPAKPKNAVAAKVAAAKAKAKPTPAPAKPAAAGKTPAKKKDEEGEDIEDALTPEETKKVVAAKKASKPRTQYHRLYFCEPCGLDLKALSNKGVGEMKSEIVNVTEEFYNSLWDKAPKKYGKDETRAYVFGTKYPLEEYKQIQEHESDGKQTGLIDFDLLEEVPDVADKWEECFGPAGWEWENRAALKKFRKYAPFVIFTGNTETGAKLYAHYSGVGKQIDGLIIDSGHFF